jgi:hypothetical protein
MATDIHIIGFLMKKEFESPSGESLATKDTVSAFVYQMLEIASAGGMTEARAKELYDEIMGCYTNLDDSALEQFRNAFVTILEQADPERN